jgi:hypothetical protein
MLLRRYALTSRIRSLRRIGNPKCLGAASRRSHPANRRTTSKVQTRKAGLIVITRLMRTNHRQHASGTCFLVRPSARRYSVTSEAEESTTRPSRMGRPGHGQRLRSHLFAHDENAVWQDIRSASVLLMSSRKPMRIVFWRFRDASDIWRR